MTPFEDYIAGADSDSGYYVQLHCPKCKGEHTTTVSTIGWYAYRCKSSHLFGSVTGWADGHPPPNGTEVSS